MAGLIAGQGIAGAVRPPPAPINVLPGGAIMVPGPEPEQDAETGAMVTNHADGGATVDFGGEQGDGLPQDLPWDANLAEHLLYFNWLFATRQWIAGEAMTLADFALAAHLSTLDYLGDVLWDSAPETRQWYARIKSRPAFRTITSPSPSNCEPNRK